jgi:precorrin-8X/cobalt-precorrin-8 methylmutase
VGVGHGIIVRVERLFDRYVMVDWSANSTPKRGRDSIWIADSAKSRPVNPSTRAAAMELVCSIVDESAGERLLIGFDFSFGYPAGFASALTGDPTAGWAAVWAWLASAISDDERNRNDRLDVAAAVNERLAGSHGSAPFWGYPGRARTDALPRTRPVTYRPFDEFRLAEHRVRAEGHRPFASWQLAYPGSVGSQMMLGMRALELLRRDPRRGPRLRVWPFETGVGAASAVIDQGQVMLAEIWPSMFALRDGLHEVRDAAQVATMVADIAERDAAGCLVDWFDPPLDDDERRVVLAEEGWTLGVR